MPFIIKHNNTYLTTERGVFKRVINPKAAMKFHDDSLNDIMSRSHIEVIIGANNIQDNSGNIVFESYNTKHIPINEFRIIKC
jgi:predicted P-loop ATPase/GTPase